MGIDLLLSNQFFDPVWGKVLFPDAVILGLSLAHRAMAFKGTCLRNSKIRSGVKDRTAV
jgi:hypothetical protein